MSIELEEPKQVSEDTSGKQTELQAIADAYFQALSQQHKKFYERLTASIDKKTDGSD